MVNRARMRSTGASVVAIVGACFLTGCALIRVPPVPRFGWRAGAADASCTADIARAHSALAAAGAAAGDPAATAAAHAQAAAAMAAYHVCLARPSQP